MVFGLLVGEFVGFSFVLNVLLVVIFFLVLMFVFYYIGVMQWIVCIVGLFFNILFGIGWVELFNVVVNIFVGQIEVLFVICFYFIGIIKLQLFVIMIFGLVFVVGMVFVVYVQIGISVEYLFVVSFMVVLGGLLMVSIIMFVDVGKDEVQDIVEMKLEQECYVNVVMVVAVGVKDGLYLVLNIGVMLIVFVFLIVLVNGLIVMIVGMFGVEGVIIQSLFGMLFVLLMMVFSIFVVEVQVVGVIVGEKFVINEFVVYLILFGMLEEFFLCSQVILIIVLCGFVNFSFVGILLGGLGSLIFEWMGQIVKFGFWVVLVGLLFNLMSVVIVGMFFVGQCYVVVGYY